MPFEQTKVYFDGSHYIAIPHTKRIVKKRPKKAEEKIIVEENKVLSNLDIPSTSTTQQSNVDLYNENSTQTTQNLPRKKVKITTKKQLFDELYMQYINLGKNDMKVKILGSLLPYFDNYKQAKHFVQTNFERKKRNLICRRVRMCRKANLANFNYFCTFTYDDKKHTEESFKKKLQSCFKMMRYRKNWKYMGVWERAPKTNRLHFHGLFNIPENSMPGEIIEVKDYSTQFNKMQKTFQSSYFNARFGRSDFKQIDEQERRLGNALAYLMKYIEKTGEKIVYSKNLPQYFISDILDTDIVCTIGQEDKKLLLFDDFMCLDEGELMGKVSPEVIEKMRKANS